MLYTFKEHPVTMFLFLLFIDQASAHGRLLVPMPRALHHGYENDPVLDTREANPLRATAGNDWVCRHPNPTEVQATLQAGSVASFDYRLTARHIGDCDFSISYDWDKPLADMQWFKIANFPNCKDQGTMVTEGGESVEINRVEVTLPSWLKTGRAVLRWGWWGLHNWPSVEFFNQCSDVDIVGVQSLPTDLQKYTLPGVYPKDANEGVGYRNEWAGQVWGSDGFWMTGPPCAMDSDLNNCLLNSGTSTTTSAVETTTTTTTEATTSTNLPENCERFVPVGDCLNDAQCQVLCTHDNGSLCPVDICKCEENTSSTSTTSTTTTSSTSTTETSTSTTNSAPTSTTETPAPTSTTETPAPTSTETSTSTSTSSVDTDQGDQVRICYFENWGRYFPTFGGEDVFEKGLDPTLCTHIQYGFVTIEDNSWDLTAFDPNADYPSGHATSPCPTVCVPGYTHDWSSGEANPCEWPCAPDRKRRGLDGMLKLKEDNPSITLLASVGGWNFNDCKKTDQTGSGAFTCHMFSTIASTEENSRTHALKVIDFLRLWGFDGYDIDWEYPVAAEHNNVDMASRPEDFANYIRFLNIIREEFEQEAANAIDGRDRLLLTAAVGVGKPTVDESYDVSQMNDVLDLISLMTYDMNGAWEPSKTNFNAPLFATSEDSQLKGYPLSVEWAVDYWIEKGASPNKLVLGMATYGRGWTLANAGQNQGALSAATGPCSAGPLTQMGGYLAYSEIQDLIQNQGAIEYWDSERKVPYVISADGTEWIGFDDSQSLTLKTNFLMDRGLRGAMFWALELDDVTGEYSNGQVYPLINSVKTVMSGYRNSGSTTTASSTTSTTLTTTSSTTSTTTPVTSSSTTSTTTPVTSSSTTTPVTSSSTTSTTTPVTSSSCFNVKSTAECETANQQWNMCENAGTWWTTQQCAQTCNRC